MEIDLEYILFGFSGIIYVACNLFCIQLNYSSCSGPDLQIEMKYTEFQGTPNSQNNCEKEEQNGKTHSS